MEYGKDIVSVKNILLLRWSVTTWGLCLFHFFLRIISKEEEEYFHNCVENVFNVISIKSVYTGKPFSFT